MYKLAYRIKHRIKYYLGLEERKNWFECIGISSEVCDSDNNTIGHVIFLDCEDIKLIDLKHYIQDVFDTFFIFQSSPGSYHVIIPVVYSRDVAKDIMDHIEPEHDPHTEIGYKRGDWVLRLSDKPDKPEPELIMAESRTCTSVYSKPHLEAINDKFDSYEARKLLKYGNTRGENLKMINYCTYK